jgi:hypothetical protein
MPQSARSGPTAGATDKGEIWRIKPPDAESAPAPHALCGGWGCFPESAAGGEHPHLSVARGVGQVLLTSRLYHQP